MTPNIVFQGGTAVDDVARTAAATAQSRAQNAETTAQSAQLAAQQALSGGAQDDIARSALASVAAITTNDWGIDTTLAAGVTEIVGSGSVGGTDIGDKDIQAGDPTARYAGVADEIAGTQASGSAVELGFGTLDGEPSIQQSHLNDDRGVFLTPQTATPVLNAGTTLWLHLPKVRLQNETALRVNLFLKPGTGASKGTLDIDLASGTVGVVYTWSTGTADAIGNHVTPPTANEVVVTDLGGGVYDLKVPFAVTTTTNAGNWGLYVCTATANGAWAGDGSDTLVEFVDPVVIPNSPDAIWPAQSVIGWEVADPTVGVHVRAIPLALAATSIKPGSALVGALEITGTNSKGTNALTMRLDVAADGAPQLYVTEDGHASSRTMTLPQEQWTTDTEREVALLLVERGRIYEVLLALERSVVTGIAVTEAPLIERYRVSLPRASAVATGNGLKCLLDSGYRSTTDINEIHALNQFPGLHYVELGAL